MRNSPPANHEVDAGKLLAETTLNFTSSSSEGEILGLGRHLPLHAAQRGDLRRADQPAADEQRRAISSSLTGVEEASPVRRLVMAPSARCFQRLYARRSPASSGGAGAPSTSTSLSAFSGGVERPPAADGPDAAASCTRAIGCRLPRRPLPAKALRRQRRPRPRGRPPPGATLVFLLLEGAVSRCRARVVLVGRRRRRSAIDGCAPDLPDGLLAPKAPDCAGEELAVNRAARSTADGRARPEPAASAGSTWDSRTAGRQERRLSASWAQHWAHRLATTRRKGSLPRGAQGQKGFM